MKSCNSRSWGMGFNFGEIYQIQWVLLKRGEGNKNKKSIRIKIKKEVYKQFIRFLGTEISELVLHSIEAMKNK